MKYMGKGAFTKCYLKDCGARVLLVSTDPIKECMAWGWFPDSTLFPKVDMIEVGTYEMDYYPSTRGLKEHLEPEQWELYQTLRRCFSESPHVKKEADLYSSWYSIFEDAREKASIKVIKEGIGDVLEALDGCANCGSDIQFEVSPRNVRARGGKLVLMDCFFMVSSLEKVRRNNE